MKPPLDIDKGLSTSDVVNHNDPMGPPIIPVGPRCASGFWPRTEKLLPWDPLAIGQWPGNVRVPRVRAALHPVSTTSQSQA